MGDNGQLALEVLKGNVQRAFTRVSEAAAIRITQWPDYDKCPAGGKVYHETVATKIDATTEGVSQLLALRLADLNHQTANRQEGPFERRNGDTFKLFGMRLTGRAAEVAAGGVKYGLAVALPLAALLYVHSEIKDLSRKTSETAAVVATGVESKLFARQDVVDHRATEAWRMATNLAEQVKELK